MKAAAPGCPIILVGTKIDERDQIKQENDREKVKSLVSFADLNKSVRKYDLETALECSAKTR